MRVRPRTDCPCQAPRLCLLCGLPEPCGLQGPGAKPGDAPICTMEPETYAELVERVRAAYRQIAELRQDADRLRSIHENGLCADWLTECGEPRPTWERFCELVDEEVAMDRREQTPEFQAEIAAAMEDCERQVREAEENK